MTNPSLDHLRLSKQSADPLYMQIYQQIKEMIESGRLRPNEKLPPVRQLAGRLRVNVVTVIHAYAFLEREQMVIKKRGSGTYVQNTGPPNSSPWHMEQGKTDIHRQLASLLQHDQVITPEMMNFASHSPSPELFPVEAFRDSLLHVLERDQGYVFGYQDPKGYGPLRDAFCTLSRERGIAANPDQILVVAGAQQGIDLIAKSLVRPGDHVLVERPSYMGAMEAFLSRNAVLHEIPIGSEGMNLEAMEQTIRAFQPRLFYTIPNFQDPTGFSYDKKHRETLLALAEQYDFYILEDDHLNELTDPQAPAVSLKSLDAQERVFYVKSFSKMFMPGLRLGYMIVPEQFGQLVVNAKQATDLSTSGLLQRALAHYIVEGAWNNHMERLILEFRERFRAMAWQLQVFMPKQVAYRIPAGGLHFWLRLPEHINMQLLVQGAFSRNVLVAPGELFYCRNPEKHHIKIGVAAVKMEEISEGTQILAHLISSRDRIDRLRKNSNKAL